MLPLIKYKIVLFVITVSSLTICALIICIGALDMYADMRGRVQRNATLESSPYRLTVLSMFSLVNISIFANIVYMSIYALRGLRYTWYMGCNYLLYVLSEIISAVIVVTEYQSLRYSHLLAGLVSLLAVFLFIITFAAEQIFTELEELTAADVDNQFGRVIWNKYQRSIKYRRRCVNISLNESNKGAGPSRSPQKSSSISTITTVSAL